MWPLALLRAIGLSAFSLLVVQDLVIVGFGLVCFRFGLELAEAHWPAGRLDAWTVGAVVLVLLLASPWIYWAASYDFHFQPIAAFFAALCARDLWFGRRRTWLWVACVLACGDVAASYLVGIGFAGVVAGAATRRRGALVLVAGIGWILFVVAVGSGKGSSLAGNYGYLAGVGAGTGLGSTVSVATGILTHPGNVLHVLRLRFGELWKFVATSGTVGIVSPLGAGIALTVLVPNTLNQSPVFIGAMASFQSLVAVGFLAVGAVMVLTWVARRWRHRAVLLVLEAVVLVPALVVSAHWLPRIRTSVSAVSAPAAAALAAAEARIPADAEVVVSQGVIGRFGAHREVFPFLDAFSNGQTVPVRSSTVVFVFVPHDGIELATSAQTAAATALVRDRLHAAPILTTPDVSVFVWHPPRGTSSVVFTP